MPLALPIPHAAPSRGARLALPLVTALFVAGCAAPPPPPRAEAPSIPAPAHPGGAAQPIAPAAPQPLYDPAPQRPVTPNPAATAAFAPPPAPQPPATPAPAPPQQSFAPAGASVTHMVVRGDTVFSLGRRYGSTPAAIQAANGLDSAFTIRVGQNLVIPTSGAPLTATTAPIAPVAPAAPSAPPAPMAPPARPQPLLPPVDGPIVGVFGERAGSAPNAGVDIGAPVGSVVRAAADGTVIFVSEPHPTVGHVIILEHAGGMRTVYGLVDQVAVQPGQYAARGAPLAVVARPAPGGQPMLHFEIRRGSEPIDPTPYLRGGRML